MQAQDATAVYLFKLWPWIEANKKRIVIGGAIIIALALVLSFVSWQAGKKEQLAGEALTLALVTTEPGQLSDAFLKIAADHPSTLAGQRAVLQAAAALFQSGRYADAQAQFQSFLDAHPDSQFSGQAALGVAASLDAQGKTDLAVGAYQRAISDLNDVEGTGIAKLAVARIYETQGKVNEALGLYGDVVRASPGSAIGSEASMRAMELKSKATATPSSAAAQPGPFNLSH
jgi:predicted negative regulator of RcsB-dependent stress response